MNTSQVIIQYLAAAGIRHVFGYPGDPSVEFLEAARREGMSFILGSREGTAESSGPGGDTRPRWRISSRIRFMTALRR